MICSRDDRRKGCGKLPGDMDDALDQLLEAWQTNHRINLLLIDRISDEGMKATLSTRGGRSVARQFAHMHAVRVWQLENRAKDLAEGLVKFASKEEPSKKALEDAMTASTARVADFFKQCVSPPDGRKRRGFKKGVIPNLGYFIAHESHHRGNILLTLKQSGHNPDKKTRYAIWNWDRI